MSKEWIQVKDDLSGNIVRFDLKFLKKALKINELEDQINELKKRFDKYRNDFISDILDHQTELGNQLEDIRKEIKNFKEYEEMIQDITMEHIVKQDGKRIMEKLKSVNKKQ